MRIDAIVSVSCGEDGRLHADVAPADSDEAFSIDVALVVVSIWQEAAGVIRGRLRHPRSGTTALVQGNGALLALGTQLGAKRRQIGASKD